MGKCWSKSKNVMVPNKKKANKELTLAILGLDNAGKTCVTKVLKGESIDDAVPTIGFASAKFKFGKFNVNMFDLGGGARIRGIWKTYLPEVYGILYVVDSSDLDRVTENASVLAELIAEPKVQGKPLLMLLNKQDVDGALTETVATAKLNLEALVNQYKCPCRVELCSMKRQDTKLDPSLKRGFQWLMDYINANRLEMSLRVAQDMQLAKVALEQERLARAERVKKARLERGESPEAEDLNIDKNDPHVNPFKPMSEIKKTLNKVKPFEPAANSQTTSNGAASLQNGKMSRSHDESYPEFRPNRPLSDTGQVTKLPPIPEANPRLKSLPPLPHKHHRALPPHPSDSDSMDISQLIQSHRRLKAAQTLNGRSKSSDDQLSQDSQLPRKKRRPRRFNNKTVPASLDDSDGQSLGSQPGQTKLAQLNTSEPRPQTPENSSTPIAKSPDLRTTNLSTLSHHIGDRKISGEPPPLSPIQC